jgi:hypothetical protein
MWPNPYFLQQGMQIFCFFRFSGRRAHVFQLRRQVHDREKREGKAWAAAFPGTKTTSHPSVATDGWLVVPGNY